MLLLLRLSMSVLRLPLSDLRTGVVLGVSHRYESEVE